MGKGSIPNGNAFFWVRIDHTTQTEYRNWFKVITRKINEQKGLTIFQTSGQQMPAKEIFLNTKWGKIEKQNKKQPPSERNLKKKKKKRLRNWWWWRWWKRNGRMKEWERKRKRKRNDGTLRASFYVYLHWNWYNLRTFLNLLTSQFIFIFELQK